MSQLEKRRENNTIKWSCHLERIHWVVQNLPTRQICILETLIEFSKKMKIVYEWTEVNLELYLPWDSTTHLLANIMCVRRVLECWVFRVGKNCHKWFKSFHWRSVKRSHYRRENRDNQWEIVAFQVCLIWICFVSHHDRRTKQIRRLIVWPRFN